MAASLSSLLANEAVIRMAGHEAFARAMVYVRTGRVSDVDLDLTRLVVTGRVQGTYRDGYATSVSLVGGEGGRTAHHGRCTCPVEIDCKHAAAVLIAARGMAEIAQALDRPAWEEALTRLARAADPAPPAEELPLGLQFDVERTPAYRHYPGGMALRVRPVRHGKSGRWVQTGVSWEDLEHSTRSYAADQREVLLQIRGAVGPAARYSYPRGPWIPLATVGDRLWPLLESAAKAGLALLPPAVGDQLRLPATPAEVVLDIRRGPAGELVLEPQVRLGEARVHRSQVGLLGEPAHGLFFLEEAARGGVLTLVPLHRPLSRQLRQLLVDPEPVVVPAGDEERYWAQFHRHLRTKAVFTSSDASVPLPEPAPPLLTCQVNFRPQHPVRIDWAWAYDVAGSRQTFSLDELPGWPTVRDAGAERQILARLPLPYDRLPQLAEDPTSREPAAHALLAGSDAVTFVADVVPQLTGAGVEVTTVGEVLDYRRPDLPPVVEVSATDRPGTADWFDLHITVSVDGEKANFDELFVALAAGEDCLILDTGVCLALDRPEFVALRDLIEEARGLREPTEAEPGRLTISKFHAGLWEDLLQLGIVIDQSDAWARTVAGLVGATGIPPVPVPASLQATLRPYQLDGYRWLAFLYDRGLGGILADDMGLGKTLQALALICRAREQAPGEPPFLVVAPTSVVANWGREAARFAPTLRVVTIEQSETKRGASLADLVAGADVVVTSYALLRIDIDRYAPLAWRGMLLDEGQFVKNHRAKTYSCARRIRAPFKLAITGTPLENTLMDLWALLSITAAGLFPHPDRFAEQFQRPIERGHDAERLDRLRRRIRPLMLRRTKNKVAAELPPKQEQVLEVALQPKHLRIYQTHLQRERQKVLGLLDDLTQNRFTILSSLTLLRQLSLDPSLVDPAYAGVASSKIEVLCEHLAELAAEGHRALVFSQFPSFLAKVKERLAAEGLGYSYLDGSTRRRAAVVAEFTGGENPVFLISLKAGGYGLNLTEADYCFVLDPWWNPAAEAQAVDRTHRIGQTRSVMVYRLVAKDTIEEKVMQLKERKEQLFDAVLGGDALASAALTAEEIRGLIGA